ncbi:chemotaxis protein CheA [Chloroflexus sp.]|uniref:chemotaxis protein CheA n=1 Tax=Chloroflexus sp. TaxID=1904827 RepID=UPI002ADD4F3D|nr:ATP-binding protein [Chloroflexus sp.]
MLRHANDIISALGTALTRLSYQARDNHELLADISTRMQAQVQRTRMSPLSRIVGSLRLHVRDLDRSTGKEVTFVGEDSGAEADRQDLDQVYEICLHLLRNAVDHGIEPPEVRQARGKAPTGLIRLTANTSSDRLNLVIGDDGAGIDREDIKQHAPRLGLLSQPDSKHVDDVMVLDLIFTPGFSTKSHISELSRRGVGLDVVRTTIERMGGSVTVMSVPGQGATFTLALPLTLMRTRGLLIYVNNQIFALPVDSLRRVV